MDTHEALKILGALDAEKFEDVRAAHKTLAIKYHPDKHPENKTAQNKLTKINAAFTFLSKEHSSNSLVLPYKNINKIPGIDLFQNMDEHAAAMLANYFAEEGPTILQSFFKGQKGKNNIKAILNAIGQNSLVSSIPKKIQDYIKKQTTKSKIKPKKQENEGILYIHASDFNIYKKAKSNIRKSIALRCLLEIKKPYYSQERLDLTFPKGIDLRSKISLNGYVYPVKLLDLGFGDSHINNSSSWSRGQIFPD